MWPFFLTRPYVTLAEYVTSETKKVDNWPSTDEKGRQSIRETHDRLEAADLGVAHANIYFRLDPVPGQQDGRPGRQMVRLVHDADRDTVVNLESLEAQLRNFVEQTMST
eukprot:g7319.t1